MTNWEIIPYEDRYQAAFKQLNAEWLEEFKLMEPRDLEVLNDPRATIIEPGGEIFLVRSGDEIVGSAAVMIEHGEYELAKMSVAKPYRGKGISKQLIELCIASARSKGATRLILYSNHQLKPALLLYEQYGFQYLDATHTPFETADVMMELHLT